VEEEFSFPVEELPPRRVLTGMGMWLIAFN